MSTELKLQVARKDHRCTNCGKRIPKGHKYWRQYDDLTDRKEHTNCLEYKDEPEYPRFPRRTKP